MKIKKQYGNIYVGVKKLERWWHQYVECRFNLHVWLIRKGTDGFYYKRCFWCGKEDWNLTHGQ